MYSKTKSINNITDNNAYAKYIKKYAKKIFSYEFMESKCKIWKQDKFMNNYPLQEEFLEKLFTDYKSNKDKESVFLKVKILDSFYSTNLKEGINDMVSNITNKKVDFEKRLRKGDIKLINDIKNVKSTQYDKKECISFASKYCNRYQKDKFPIYDKYVKEMLLLINKATKFYGRNITMNQINKMTYIEYCEIINKFIEKFNADKNEKQKINYKLFDRYIWTWAKEILNDLNKKNIGNTV